MMSETEKHASGLRHRFMSCEAVEMRGGDSD